MWQTRAGSGGVLWGFQNLQFILWKAILVEDSLDFWSGPVQSYNSPVEDRFLTGMDRSTNGPLPDCDRKYVLVRTMPPGYLMKSMPLLLDSEDPINSLP